MRPLERIESRLARNPQQLLRARVKRLQLRVRDPPVLQRMIRRQLPCAVAFHRARQNLEAVWQKPRPDSVPILSPAPHPPPPQKTPALPNRPPPALPSIPQ